MFYYFLKSTDGHISPTRPDGHQRISVLHATSHETTETTETTETVLNP